tara:strand:+ start:942 stop:1313 length:372 start_codon:yes stop_codon:yes gene_type:complete
MSQRELRYSKDHEWIRAESDKGKIGITAFAQEQLGEIVYVELPEVGSVFAQGDQFGSIESVKAVSDLYCPVSGVVIGVNESVVDAPDLVNKDPEAAWLIEIELNDSNEMSSLLESAEYDELVK